METVGENVEHSAVPKIIAANGSSLGLLILNVLNEVCGSAIHDESTVATSDGEVAVDVVELAINVDDILGHCRGDLHGAVIVSDHNDGRFVD